MANKIKTPLNPLEWDKHKEEDTLIFISDF